MQASNSVVKPVPKPCAGVVCVRDDQVLLIRRGRPPREGMWSIPGGKVESGESLCDAARRELLEETGITADIGPLIEVYEIIEPDYHYVLIDYLAHWTGGEPVAGDDADRAVFLPWDEALSCVEASDLKDVLTRARSMLK
jgi:8-oxo-dGTP diphosphatase